MIDTVKLLVPFSKRPVWIAMFRTLESIDVTSGFSRMNINPSSAYKKSGIYLPRLTYSERPNKEVGRTYQLAIEVSVPKLIFGNNFSEVINTDIGTVTQRLSDVLNSTYNICIPSEVLATAKVARIDYCKNIVFDDYTPISTIVGSMRTADISKTYDVQKTDFKNGGHIWHIHTNSLDVAMYDKLADLKQEKVSPKRSQEKDGYSQLSLIDLLEDKKSLSIARFEVRLNSTKKIRTELEAVGFLSDTTFHDLYSVDLARKVLTKHWIGVFNKIPKALLDTDTPEQLLLNITKANPEIKAREALALVGVILLAHDKDERYLRNLLEGLFTPSQYRRLKSKSREPPKATQLKTLIAVTDALTEMNPVSIEDYC